MNNNRSFGELVWTPDLAKQVKAALAEDLGAGDVTTQRIVPQKLDGRGELICKERGVLCGMRIAERVWELCDKDISVNWHAKDGADIVPGQIVATLQGSMRGMLTGERVALNFLQHMSGIATLTAKFHQALGGAGGPVVCDTRKTTPLWRYLERYAVRVGGGVNHRDGLFDMILIKENHARAAGSFREAIQLANTKRGRLRLAVEARDPDEVRICCEERVDLILLDNFTPTRARAVIARFRPAGIPFEISGGVNLRNIRAFAQSGADRISIGALTHSAPALDLSLQLYRGEQVAD